MVYIHTLQPETNQKSHLPSIDGIRAISIFLVLGAHLTGSINFNQSLTPFTKYIFDGGLGVNIFFVISGFLITYLLTKEKFEFEKINLKRFYIRRILRIFPVYYFFIFVLFILEKCTKLNFTTFEYVSSIFFFKNFGAGQWIDGHLWSLAVEEQFYLIWPLVFKYTSDKQKVWFALSLIVLAPMFRIVFYMNNLTQLRNFSFFVNMDSLMIGSLLGMYFFKQNVKLMTFLIYKTSLFRIIAFLAIYLIWVLQSQLILGWITVPLGKTIQSISTAYLIASYIKCSIGLGYKMLNWKPIVHIGVLSYSIYIWQQLFFSHPTIYSDNDISLLHIPYNILGVIIVSIISYYFLETPFIKLRNKFKSTIHVVQ